MQHRDYFEKEVRTVLCVRDLERSRNFYQQTLELVPVWDGGMEGCRFAADCRQKVSRQFFLPVGPGGS